MAVRPTALCGETFDKGWELPRHQQKCPTCQELVKLRDQGLLGQLYKSGQLPSPEPASPQGSPLPPPRTRSPESKVELPEEPPEEFYPGPGPERLRAILINQRFARSEAERICRAFANNRWAWNDFSMLANFLQQHQVPAQTAMAVAAEYYQMPAGPMPFSYPGMGGVSQFPPYGFFPPNPFHSSPYGPYPPYSTPYQTSPREAPQDGATTAAVKSLGDAVTTIISKTLEKSGGGDVQAALEQFSQRMEDRVENLKALSEYRNDVNKLLLDMKDSQLQEIRRQYEATAGRLSEMEKRNPAQEFSTWRKAIEDSAKDLGYIPPGSQDIYGAISGAVKEVNETVRSGFSSIFQRAPKDQSLEQRRKLADEKLKEESLLQAALEAARAAEAQRRGMQETKEQAEAASEAPPAPQARLTRVEPEHRMSVDGTQLPKEEYGEGKLTPRESGPGGPESSPARSRKLRPAKKAGG